MSAYLNKDFLNIIDENKIKIIVELGTRDGDDTICLAKYYTNSNILTFECNPNTIYVCRNTIENSNFKDRIKFFDFGVGKEENEIEFYPYKLGNPGASSFYKRYDFDQSQETYKEKIKIRRLDVVLKENNIEKVDLICADIQGYEMNALIGIGDYLKNVDYIILEAPREKPYIPSVYLGAPNRETIEIFMNNNGFKSSVVTYENDLEDNVLYEKIKEII